MRILFLNQYFPPDSAPTGMYLSEVAEMLKEKGHLVTFISSGESYRNEKRCTHRWLKEFKSLGKMLVQGLLHPKPDVVISATSPPCLLLIATLIAVRHKAKSLHWGFDIYPDLAVKLGELKEGIVAILMRNLMAACYRSCAAVIALDEDMAKYFCQFGVKTRIISPWALSSINQQCSSSHGDQVPWTWIYSGNLGRAHEWETLLEAQAFIEKKCSDIQLVFQGGGPAWPAAQMRAGQLGLRNCVWRPYVSEEALSPSLLKARCCVVTQSPLTIGLIWPSKLALLLNIPRPILWVGPKKSAIAHQLSSIPQAGVFSPGEAEAVANWLLELRDQPPVIFQKDDRAVNRQHGLTVWETLVSDLNFAQNQLFLGCSIMEGKI